MATLRYTEQNTANSYLMVEGPLLKVINEVPTRRNSTSHMLAKGNEHREPLWVSQKQITPLIANDDEIKEERSLDAR